MKYATRTALLAATALGMNFAMPAFAQDAQEEADDAASSSDIIVTAQRTDQRLQDVPISITVLTQEALANNNITNAKDLAAFTPGLAVNNRYGADNTTFTMRGFYQEQRSFATVGVFFADVVAPRGSGATFGGDGAGPGALFDLARVEVLKGPQGTLFGRNSTGGAIQLVPVKPKDKTEGYIEGSLGNYDMWRLQGVANFAISETARMRIGFDHQDRKGYLKNVGRFGDGDFDGREMGDVNYWAARASAGGRSRARPRKLHDLQLYPYPEQQRQSQDHRGVRTGNQCELRAKVDNRELRLRIDRADGARGPIRLLVGL